MVEENDVLNELYGVIIMRKIQLSKPKHRFWIHYKKAKKVWSILSSCERTTTGPE